MKKKNIMLVVYTLATVGQTVFAQVPQLINYQGRLAVGGTNFNGVGLFQFVLVNNGASQTFWSNGANYVSMPVNKGLYAVLLGDTTLANMAALPATVFTNSDVRLRVWFDDGVHAVQLLAPDQRIAAAGYALVAQSAQTANVATVASSYSAASDLTAARLNIGSGNTLSGSYATIGGGQNNTVSNGCATIAGGSLNFASGFTASVGGGYRNTASANYAMIGGGELNNASGSYAAVGGGYRSTASGDDAFIGGGIFNLASGYIATVGGGYQNTASSDQATVGGGYQNTASGWNATVPGGCNNLAGGQYSFAMGCRAKATNDGAFVWADSQTNDFFSTATNQVNFRCAGGVRFTSGSGAANQTVAWTPGGASWSFSSDRKLKEAIHPIAAQAVLQQLARLPISEWNYIGYAQRHIGPMAQDFHALFPLNASDTTLNDADLHGVALAAIQGLYQELQDERKELREEKARNYALEKRLADLEHKLTQSSATGK